MRTYFVSVGEDGKENREYSDLDSTLYGISDMMDRLDEKIKMEEQKNMVAEEKYHASTYYGTHQYKKLDELKDIVNEQASCLSRTVGEIDDFPKYLYENHEKFEMPRFISMTPNKTTGMYHETIMDSSMDGPTTIQLLASTAPLVSGGKAVSYDFVDYKTYISKETNGIKTVNPGYKLPCIAKEFIRKDRETGVETMAYYKTVPTPFVVDEKSKIQPRLDVRLSGITQEEANGMYWKAEEAIVKNLEAKHPEAYATLTDNQKKFKTLPRYITKNTPIPVQEAMKAKEFSQALIAIKTHMPEDMAKVNHVAFIDSNPEFDPFHPNNTGYAPEVNEKMYDIAIAAQNATETATAIVLGKRIKMVVAAEKGMSNANIHLEQGEKSLENEKKPLVSEQTKENIKEGLKAAAKVGLDVVATKHAAGMAAKVAVDASGILDPKEKEAPKPKTRKRTRTVAPKAKEQSKSKDVGMEM